MWSDDTEKRMDEPSAGNTPGGMGSESWEAVRRSIKEMGGPAIRSAGEGSAPGSGSAGARDAGNRGASGSGSTGARGAGNRSASGNGSAGTRGTGNRSASGSGSTRGAGNRGSTGSGRTGARGTGNRRSSGSRRSTGTRGGTSAGGRETLRKRKRRRRVFLIEAALVCVLLILLVILAVTARNRRTKTGKTAQTSGSVSAPAKAGSTDPGTAAEGSGAETDAAGSESGAAGAESLPAGTESGDAGTDGNPSGGSFGVAFHPHAVESTDPDNMIRYTEIMWNGEFLEDESVYDPWYNFHFGTGDTYTDMDGVVTFRGNNFRDDPTYGSTGMKDYTLTKVWERTTGTLDSLGRTWSGNGWTGQPLIVRWPASTKAVMNMYDSAKQKDGLVEVIYAGMDGRINFMDLETGEATRDSISLGYTFKGAGALDPRGYPILYVGAGYDSDNGKARVFIVSLIDGSVMYRFGNGDEFSMRGSLSYFDSSPLVDAASDTLIYPGENGVLYLIKLNTKYDEAAGTLSIEPGDRAKWRYMGYRTDTANYWLGMEGSAAVYDKYLFIADNGGHLMCLDLQTLQLVWTQDVLDDTNGSPVLSIEDGHLYLYISTSFHLGWRSSTTATIPVWKIDAETGEKIWHKDYECYSVEGVSGGVQSTIAVGKGDLDRYVYVTVARTGSDYGGVLACLDKKTGESVWEHEAVYTWSSPVCLYGADGTGKVLYFSAAGKGYLLDGKTGETNDVYDPGECTLEASPAVFGDMVVVGTRDCYIRGFKLG